MCGFILLYQFFGLFFGSLFYFSNNFFCFALGFKTQPKKKIFFQTVLNISDLKKKKRQQKRRWKRWQFYFRRLAFMCCPGSQVRCFSIRFSVAPAKRAAILNLAGNRTPPPAGPPRRTCLSRRYQLMFLWMLTQYSSSRPFKAPPRGVWRFEEDSPAITEVLLTGREK